MLLLIELVYDEIGINLCGWSRLFGLFELGTSILEPNRDALDAQPKPIR